MPSGPAFLSGIKYSTTKLEKEWLFRFHCTDEHQFIQTRKVNFDIIFQNGLRHKIALHFYPTTSGLLAGDRAVRACVRLPQVVEGILLGNTSWFWMRFDPNHGIKAKTNHLWEIHTISNEVVQVASITRPSASWRTLPGPPHWRLCGSPTGSWFLLYTPLTGIMMVVQAAQTMLGKVSKLSSVIHVASKQMSSLRHISTLLDTLSK